MVIMVKIILGIAIDRVAAGMILLDVGNVVRHVGMVHEERVSRYKRSISTWKVRILNMK